MTPSAEYLRAARDVVERIASGQGEPIAAAGRLVANAIAAGGVLHVFGCGHSHLIAAEAFYRAGGLAAVNPVIDPRLAFMYGALESTRAERRPGYAREILARERVEPRDVAAVVSNSGRNVVPVEMALELRGCGVPVVAITSIEHSRSAAPAHASGRRLFEVADVTIDTCVPAGDAGIRVPGVPVPMGPLSTIAGAAIIHAVAIAAAAELGARGVPVPVLPSANVPGTTEDSLRSLLSPYGGRVRYLDLEDEVDGRG